MIRIAICDDYPKQTEAVSGLLSEYRTARPGLEIHSDSFTTSTELLDCIKAGKAFDLFLLDIMMPGLNGIDLAREIREHNNDAHIIFLTGSEDYALEAFNVQAAQYILKPVKEAELFAALDKVISILQRDKDSFLLVSLPDRRVKILYSSIVCVESAQRKLQFYLSDGGTLCSKTIRIPFETVVSPLLQDSRFLFAHKSFVLNMSLAEELTKDSFIMKNGIEIHIPKYKYPDAKNKYLGYLSAEGIGLLGGVL